ncbi:Uncharacterised protein [Klebsiella michiganensis]|uniref:Uncharacterized protein n=1 Tax=Klebsiella michiganensis TaxID=1134687 RepID=A0A7H4LV83_9ENTR|nr:Uncharacterised protein [Klebsiella michiganensis]
MDIIFYHPTFDTLSGLRNWKNSCPARASASGNPEIINPLTMRWSGIRR